MKPLDLIGKKFGRLEVQDEVKIPSKQGTYWRCVCECGAEKVILGSSLTKSDRPTRSCGCLAREKSAAAALDLTGKSFGKLIPVAITDRKKTGCYWLCRCECGQETTVRSSHLLSGSVSSCGCSYNDYWKTMAKPDSCYKVVYRSYKKSASVKNRSFNIRFEDFKKLILSDRCYCGATASNIRAYKGVSFQYNGIDRIDNTKGYELDNCTSCCSICNRAKGNSTFQEYKDWLEKAYKGIQNVNF